MALATATVGLLAYALATSPAAQAENIRDREWYLDAMEAGKMWQVSTGSGVTVAVVDSGVDAAAPELSGRVLPGKDFESAGGDAHQDPDGHGTDMATLIAGDGNSGNGVMGLAPGARILPLRVGIQPVSGSGYVQSISESVRYAADHGAKIINVSGGILESESSPRDRAPLDAAVKYALSRGALVFAASGNEGDKGNSVGYPAASPGAVAVAALDESGNVTKFSTYGPQVALAAPGKDIPGQCSKSHGTASGYCVGDGTSQATALASASAALIWAKHPDWTNNQVLRVLIKTAGRPKTGKVPSAYIGYGSVRPRIALLDNPGDPGPANVNPLFPTLLSNSASPSANAGSSAGSSTAPGTAGHSSPVKGSSTNTILWIGLGVGAVVVIIGVVTGLLIRRRRDQGAIQGGAVASGTSPQVPPYPGSLPPPPPPAPPGGGQWHSGNGR
ncbi:type VII secretion-associated serine protease mycosin [Streptomyces sp. NPDC054933]